MKIEAGKYYRTRDGRTVGPIRVSNIFGGSFWSDVGGSYHADGTHVSNTENDIIAECNYRTHVVGPVRDVTRKEIVPGVYGRVEVWDDCSEGGLAVDVKPIRIDISCMAELTAAIATLTLISDAMADSSGDTTTTQAR